MFLKPFAKPGQKPFAKPFVKPFAENARRRWSAELRGALAYAKGVARGFCERQMNILLKVFI